MNIQDLILLGKNTIIVSNINDLKFSQPMQIKDSVKLTTKSNSIVNFKVI